jgi:tRNA A-37 threonylcarbamoyl transferase component Bud32
VSLQELQQTLQQLERFGTLIKDRGYRQVWRFEHDGKGYYLKFYPRDRSMRRLLRGSPAMREFTRLQWLERAKIRSPHPVAVLMGFRLGRQTGDAVILEAIEPSVPLDAYLNRLQLEGRRAPDHRQLVQQIIEMVYQLGRAGLGHSDLNLGNFLLRDGQLYLLDGYAVHRRGLRKNDVLQLGHSVARYAGLHDIVRGWGSLTGGMPPQTNRLSPRIWRKFLQRARGGNRYFGRIGDGQWSGVYFRQYKYPQRSATASRLQVAEKDWETEWPRLLQQIEAGTLPVLKRSRSGEVLTAKVTLGGQSVPIVIKRPRRKYWYRYFNEIGRGSRARRAWFKAWNLIVRNIPTAWPLLLMEKRSFGYVTDAVFICQQVPGTNLAQVELDAMEAGGRELLFRRIGKILRRIEQYGFSHFDAKSSNWMILDDPVTGPQPVLVDVDGIRHRRWIALGLERLLRSMREHPQYTPPDSLALCQGYAPFAHIAPEAN